MSLQLWGELHMTLTIYKTIDRSDKLNKTLQLVKTNVPIYNKDKIDILEPVFIVDTDNTYLTANYLYCDTMLRYYFFSKPPVLLTGGKMAIYCTIDVLMTYKDGIKNSNGVIMRQSKPTDINDSKYPLSEESWLHCEVLPTGLTNTGNLHYVIGVNSTYN